MNEKDEIKMPNFLVDLSVVENLDLLSDKQFREVFNLMVQYAQDGTVDLSKVEPLVKAIFLPFKNTIEEGRAKYIKKVLRNREIAKNRKTNGNQSQPVVTNGNQSPQIKQNKSKVNKTKQSICVSKDTHIYFDSAENSPNVAVPDGTPQANKPSYKEMREYYCRVVGRDDAVLVDEFDQECQRANDYSNWKQRLLEYEGDIRC